MKNLLELYLRQFCQKQFPDATIDVHLKQKKFADYSWDGLCQLVQAFDGDVIPFAKTIGDALLTQKGVKHVYIEKPCHVNIDVDDHIRYDLIFHQILEHSPLLKQPLACQQQNIEYALLRLQEISEHLSFEIVPSYPSSLKMEEQKILKCLDELLCVLQENNLDKIAHQLNHLANHIHGYLRVITLLCEDKIKYQFQIQLLKLSELMLKTVTLPKNLKNYRE